MSPNHGHQPRQPCLCRPQRRCERRTTADGPTADEYPQIPAKVAVDVGSRVVRPSGARLFAVVADWSQAGIGYTPRLLIRDVDTR